MNKRTTTQWTTTTKRTVRGPKNDPMMDELDTLLAGCKWDSMLRDVEHMPLNKARELRAKLNNLFAS